MMREADSPVELRRAPRVVPVLLAAAVMVSAVAFAVTRANEAIAVADDPARIAEQALDGKFDAAVARREIEAALAAHDAELAQSFVDLAADRHVAVDQALADQVKAATAEAATAGHTAQSFARGLIVGEPDDAAALAGTALGDLFVFGDIRDAVREGARFAAGEKVDEVVLGLACVGIAITAATYSSFGAAAPARIGLTIAKAARKTGRLGGALAASIGRMLHGVVDWGRLRTALAGASITEPALAVRAAREAVKVERAGGLLHLVRDVGRIETKAGARAALDGLRVAENPAEVARVAKLAEKEGSRTRAILKIAGRGAIVLAGAAFDIATWILGALFALFGLVSSLKSATERVTWRVLRRRKEKRRRREQRQFAAALAHG
jgi:hypothetical protein